MSTNSQILRLQLEIKELREAHQTLIENQKILEENEKHLGQLLLACAKKCGLTHDDLRDKVDFIFPTVKVN